MKTKFLITILLFITISTFTINAQNTKSFTIVNVDKEAAWSAVLKTFKEQKLPKVYLNSKIVNTMSDYYNYSSLITKNRLRFKVDHQNDKLTISIVGRQYYTKSGWADNPLPMSKKQATKILNPLKERIIKFINEEDTITETPVTETNQEVQINDSQEKLDTNVDYIRISALDPAIGIAAVNPKTATIDLNYWEYDSRIIITKGKGEKYGSVLMEELILKLQDENIVIVERGLLDKILGELNLGSSELADPDMSLKLGKITLAGFYFIAKCTSITDKATFNYRVVYTETGEIIYANTLYYNIDTFNLDIEAEKEAPRIIAALEKFANKRVLIIKENPKRYSK